MPASGHQKPEPMGLEVWWNSRGSTEMEDSQSACIRGIYRQVAAFTSLGWGFGWRRGKEKVENMNSEGSV